MPKTKAPPGKPQLLKISRKPSDYGSTRSQEGPKGKGEVFVTHFPGVTPFIQGDKHNSRHEYPTKYKTSGGKIKRGTHTKYTNYRSNFGPFTETENSERNIKYTQRRIPHRPKASGHFEPWEKKRLTMDTPASSKPKRRKTTK